MTNTVSPPLAHAESSEEVPLDDLYSILDNERRRVTLSHLVAADGPVPVDDLVDRVADSDDGQKTAIEFHHVHLPKMEAAGVIEYDDETVVLATGEGIADHFLELGT